MNVVHHVIRLTGPARCGGRVPPEPLGSVLRAIPPIVRRSIRMAVEGRSTVRGRAPDWLCAASDIRFVDLDGDDETRLHFEAPRLGDVAEQVISQQNLWRTMPDPQMSGLDVFRKVLDEIDARNADSEAFDRRLLRGLQAGFGKGINGVFNTMYVDPQDSMNNQKPAVLNKATLENARLLSEQTPAAQRANIVGWLDMLRVSKQSFALKLDDGTEVRGVLVEGDMDDFKDFFNTRVIVHGKAVYRASGNVLRIEAEGFDSGEDAPAIWSKIPTPFSREPQQTRWQKPQSARTGVKVFFGTWPGDETDEELLAALKKLD